MELERLIKELNKLEHKMLKKHGIRKIIIEQGETKYAIQMILKDKDANTPRELTFFVDIDDTEIIGDLI